MINNNQSGFTAVELLITLFIAAAFLMSGYQLFNLVIKDSGETRAQLKASNAAYEYLQRYKTSATNPCTVVAGLPTDQASEIDVMPGATVSISITCPYGTTSTVSKVMATIKYGNPQKIVSNATYVTN